MTPVQALELALSKENSAIQLYDSLALKYPEIKKLLLFLYIRGHKTAAFRLRMESGRSVFRSRKPRASARGASLNEEEKHKQLLEKKILEITLH